MTKLTKVEGIGLVNAQKLQDAGIKTTEKLLDLGATARGRQDIAEKTGISESQILGWVNRVDLFRVKGVGEEYSDLLEKAGVDTVPELRQRNASNLYQKLVTINQEKKLVRQLPSERQVAAWIEHAKELPRVVTY